MKRLLSIMSMLACLISVNGQIRTAYYSNSECGDSMINIFMKKIESHVVPSKKITIPSAIVSKLLQEDVERDGTDVPFRFGKAIEQNLTLNDGNWVDVDNGRLWSLSIEADSALSLNFIFKDFYLADESELYIVNHDNSIVYGPVTSCTIGNGNHFLTDVIPDSKVTILLYEPSSARSLSTLTIDKTVYGYRSSVINRNGGLVNSSGSCNNDITCFPEYMQESQAVALVLLSNGEEHCSGSLVMSTDMMYKPYFLTAFHCVDSNHNDSLSEYEKANVQNWVFKFGYKKTTCGGNNATNGYSFNGSTFRAAYQPSDFALLEINQSIPQNGQYSWLGWDRSGNTPSNGTCIHHPSGDVMKISFDYNQLSSSSWGGYNTHWKTVFDDGVVEHGSSGSPLLDSENKIVGQLHGNSNYNGLLPYCDQHRGDFGKFNLSWSGGGTNDTRLSNWLDPNGTGITVMPSSYDIIIKGPEYIYNNACTYSLASLPSTMSVNWVLTGYHAANFILESNTPSTNMCRITRIDGAEFDGSANLTLSAQIMLGSNLFTTVSRNLIAPYIDGPMIPCGITTYDVYSLPINAAVAWQANGQNLNEYTAPGGQQPVPYAYVINPGSNDYVIGTLTATVMAGNNVLGVLNKYVDTTGGFSGTWYQQATLNDTINSTPKPFFHNSLLEFVPNRTVYLSSNHFNNITISHSESGVLLSGWSNSNGVISFYPGQPINYTGSSSIIIEGTAQSGCKKFRLQLFSPPSLINDPILLAKNPDGSTYEFSISEDVRSRQESSSESSNPLEWRLTIIKIDSANRVFDEIVRANSISVNVSGWSPGIYIAIAQINGQYYSRKFFVGE